MTVVHDLMAYVDGGPMFLERPLYDIDRADDARTVASRLSEYDLHGLHPRSSHPACSPHAPHSAARKASVESARFSPLPAPARSYYSQQFAGFTLSIRD